ncbi:MAG: hypothetical protein WB716_10985 [Candidatus Acidiferrales bacterium]
MRRASLYVVIATAMCLLAPIYQWAQESEWRVQLRANTVAPSTITAENASCHRTHRFKVVPDSLPFMKLLDPATFEVAPGEQHVVHVEFDTTKIEPGQQDAVITVQCLTCKSEPGCSEDHKDMHVYLTVLPTLGIWTDIHPELKGTLKQNPGLHWCNISPEKK